MDKKRLEHAINNGYRTFAPKYIKGEQYPLCPTCEQWVPKLPKIGIDNREESYNDISENEYSSESYRYEHIFSHLELNGFSVPADSHPLVNEYKDLQSAIY